MTKVKLEIISDAGMYLFFEKGIIDGVFYFSKKYSKDKERYLKSFNRKQESKYFIYLDLNNLYGYTMSKVSPTSGLKWINPKEFDLNKYTSNCSKGCVLQFDLKYSKKICELHNDYPLAPDRIEIKRKICLVIN